MKPDEEITVTTRIEDGEVIHETKYMKAGHPDAGPCPICILVTPCQCCAGGTKHELRGVPQAKNDPRGTTH